MRTDYEWHSHRVYIAAAEAPLLIELLDHKLGCLEPDTEQHKTLGNLRWKVASACRGCRMPSPVQPDARIIS